MPPRTPHSPIDRNFGRARRVLGAHDRYAAFLESGGDDDYQDTLETLRAALRYGDTKRVE